MFVFIFTPRVATRLLGGIVVALLGWVPVGLHAGQPQTTRDGVFSEAQAKRGEALYGQQCASCHSADLSGSGAPALAGTDFFGSWDKMPVADLVDKIATSMPSSSPGSLSRVQSSDLVAFILKSNNFPAGPSDLSADAAALKTITIVK